MRSRQEIKPSQRQVFAGLFVACVIVGGLSWLGVYQLIASGRMDGEEITWPIVGGTLLMLLAIAASAGTLVTAIIWWAERRR